LGLSTLAVCPEFLSGFTIIRLHQIAMHRKQNIFSPRVRKRKAYATAFHIFFSYLWLHLKSKVFGKKYFNKHVNALHLKNANKVKNRVQELLDFGQKSVY